MRLISYSPSYRYLYRRISPFVSYLVLHCITTMQIFETYMWLASRYRKHFTNYDAAAAESKRCSDLITAALKAGFKSKTKAAAAANKGRSSTEVDQDDTVLVSSNSRMSDRSSRRSRSSGSASDRLKRLLNERL